MVNPVRDVAALARLPKTALEDLSAIRKEITRIRLQSAPLGELLPALDDLKHELVSRLDALKVVIAGLEGDDSHLNQSVVALGKQLAGMQETLRALQEDVQRVTERLPDPNAPGPLGKARDLITGGD